MSRTDVGVAVATILLIVTMLYQPPLAELHLTGPASQGFLVHSWDLAWLILLLVALSVLTARRSDLRIKFSIRRVPWRDPMAALGTLAVVGTLSLIWEYANFGTNGLDASAVQCLRLVSVIVLAVMVRTLVSDRIRAAIVWAFLGVSLVAAVWALIAWREETTVYHLGLRALRVGVTRAGGPFGNWFASGSSDSWWAPPGAANGLGFWLAVATPVSVAYGLRLWRSTKLGASLTLGAVPFLIGGFLATHSRESWLASAVAGGVLLWPSLRRLRPRRQLIVAFGILGTIATVTLSLPSVSSRIDQSFSPGTFDYQSGPQARATAWQLGLRWSSESFPLGWGIGAIEEHPARFGGHTTAENVYLQYLAQLGVVGFVALVLMSVEGLRRGTRVAAARPRDAASIYVAAFFAALIVHGMFGNTLGDPTIQVLLACALGFSVAPVAVPRRGTSSGPTGLGTGVAPS